MSAEAFVQCRVTPEVKALLRMLAEREQITESALVRQLLEITLRRSVLEGLPKFEALEKVSRDARLSISLAPDDRMLLTERATARDAVGGLRLPPSPRASAEPDAAAEGGARGT